MTLPLRLFAPLSFLCAAPLAAAQGGGPQPACLPFQPDNTIEWPASGFGSALDFRRLVVAELDGDQAPEGVMNVGGLPVVLWDLVAYDAPQVIHFPSATQPTAVADIAVLPGGGDNGYDALLMTDSRGLFLVNWNGDGFADPVVLDNSSWVNAAPIHADNIDNQGGPDIYGVAADHKKILALLVSQNSTTPLTVTQPYVLTDIVAANWDQPSSPRELVALSSNRGLRVYTTAGTLLQAVNHPYPGCIARVDGSTEYVAWSRGLSSGASELMLYSGSGSSNLGQLTFDLCEWTTNITPTALLTGDYDGDGDDDLLIAHEANQTAILLIHGNVFPYYTTSDQTKFDVIPLSENAQALGDVGIPAFAQLDPEGTPFIKEPGNPEDLAFPVSATAKVQVFTRTSEVRQQQFAQGAQPPPNAGDIFHSSSEFNPGAVHGRLVIAFKLLSRYQDAGCNQVDLVVWRQNDQNSWTTGPLSHKLYTLASTSQLYQWIARPDDFLSGDCWDDPGYYYVELRFINSSTQYLSRIFTGGFRLRNCTGSPTANYPYLITQGIPGKSFDLWSNNPNVGPSGPPQIGNQLLGIFVPMSSNPPFEDGLPPTRGASSAAGEGLVGWFTP